MVWRWLIIIAGVGLVSWSLLTLDLTRNIRFVGSFSGALAVAIALWPELKSKIPIKE